MPRPFAPKRILLVRTDRMGDLLMNLPAIQAIRQYFPNTHIALLLRQDLFPLLEGHPAVDQLIPYDPAQGQGWTALWHWGRKLRPFRFDAVLIFNPTRLFHAAAFLAGIPQRMGYRRKWGFLLNSSLEDTKSIRRRHEVGYNLELLELLGIHHPSATLSIPTTADQEAQARALLEEDSTPIALHPWTSNPAKALPLDFFENVAGELSRQGRRLLWIGEPGPEIERPSRSEGTRDLTGQVPLRLLPALLKQCGILISNDSGPVHVAAAVGTPTIVVAPQAHAPVLKRWAPVGPGHTLLLSPSVQQVVTAALKHTPPH